MPPYPADERAASPIFPGIFKMMRPIDIFFDMETADPDDVFTLCLIATHPSAHLRGVSLTPGTRAQAGLVKHVLSRLGHSDVPIGCRCPEADKQAISSFHFTWLGEIPPADPDGSGFAIMARVFREFPGCVLLTGAAVHNARLMLESADCADIKISRWVAQGGFAGDSVVPAAFRLEKFAGRETCPTFNFNGDVKGAHLLLSSVRIATRDLVSKNVCHGFVYDRAFHERVAPRRHTTAGLEMIVEGMGVYLQKRDGKAFHDPLAACVAIDRTIADFREVEVYRKSGEWGSKRAVGTNTFITVTASHDRFFEILTAG